MEMEADEAVLFKVPLVPVIDPVYKIRSIPETFRKRIKFINMYDFVPHEKMDILKQLNFPVQVIRLDLENVRVKYIF